MTNAAGCVLEMAERIFLDFYKMLKLNLLINVKLTNGIMS